MDTLLPTGFILVVLPAAWLALQILCWWGLSHLVPQPRSRTPDSVLLPAEVAGPHAAHAKRSLNS